MKRPLCDCGNPVAVNYIKNNKTYFRKKCDSCLRGVVKKQPRWKTAGYKKKHICDRCGFTSNFDMQFNVYHVDGDRNNCAFGNLKTVCANCQRVLHLEGMRWRQGDLTPD